MKNRPKVFLIDNGSLRPAATFGLRALSAKLSERLDLSVEPVSLLHSHKIPAEKIGGLPATIVRRQLKACVAAGERELILLPLFLGPSSAIADYLPELIEEARATAPDLNVRIAAPLVGADVEAPDPRLAEILADHVREVIHRNGLVRPQVALVDHGTPMRLVNTVRNAVARQLESLLAEDVRSVIAASMERREGDAYAFNDPLLENLGTVSEPVSDCVVAMFFLLPGRHAGPGGDVVEICDGLLESKFCERIHQTPLMAEHPKLLEILSDRLSVVW